MIKLSTALYRNAWVWFALIPVFAVWGFWVTYFTRPAGSVAMHEHVHGVLMFAWCLLLICQALLIRLGKRDLHRLIGKSSYLIAPLIILSSLSLSNFRFGVRGPTDEAYYVLGLQLLLLLPFVVFYWQAMKNRAVPDVHARWMVCTAVTMIDPIFARIVGVNFVRVPLESGIVQLYTFALINIVMIILVFWDWRSERRKDVFLPAFALLALMEVGMLYLHPTRAWRAFAEFYASLPLS